MLLGSALPALAGADPAPPQPGGDWADWRVQLDQATKDPARTAKWGRTSEEREQIVDQVRAGLADPLFSTNRPYSEAQSAAIAGAQGDDDTKPATDDPPPTTTPTTTTPPPPPAAAPPPAAVGPALPGAPAVPGAADEPVTGPFADHLDDLMIEPGTIADLRYHNDPNRGETPEKVGEKEGADDLTVALDERQEGLEAAYASGTAADDPLAERLAAHGGGSGTSGPPPPDSDPVCEDRQGTRAAPEVGTRPGTVYTPSQDSFVVTESSGGRSGSAFSAPVAESLGLQSNVAVSGELVKRTKLTRNGAVEQFRVEAHVIDSGAIDPTWLPLMVGAPLDYFHSHIYLMWPGQADPYGADYWGASADGQIDYEILCYADDAGLTDARDLTRGYVEAWLPMTYAPFAQDLSEPGFEVRAITTDFYLLFGNPVSFFLGSDLHTVHLGPEPLAYTDTAEAGLGLTLDDSFLEDTDSSAANDIESTIEPLLESGVSAAVDALDGTSKYLLASGIPNWGWLGFTLSKVSKPGSTSVEWSTTSTTGPNGGTDDERLLKAKIELDDVEVSGHASLPVAAAGLIPCYYSAKADLDATLTMGIDSAGRGISADAEFRFTATDVHDILVVPVPLGCNLMYALNIDSLAELLLSSGDLTPFVEDGIDDQLNVVRWLPAVTLPGGGRIYPENGGFRTTCTPYGCDGEHAGDIALTTDGLEASVDAGLWSDNAFITGLGLTSTPRFPVSYQPSGVTSIDDEVQSHTAAWGGGLGGFSAAAYVSPALLNQGLATLTEGSLVSITDLTPAYNGLLDIDSRSFRTYPQVAPVFLQSSTHDVALFLPDLEFDMGGADDAYYAANLVMGVNVELGPDATLGPSTVSVGDVQAGLGISTLRCTSLTWFECVGVPAAVSTVATTLGTTVLPDLLGESLGLVSVPAIGGLSFTRGDVRDAGGNLAVYVEAG